MCDLCDLKSADRELARNVRDRYLYISERLENVAANFRKLAHGQVQPHTEEIKQMEAPAMQAIKDLVEWI